MKYIEVANNYFKLVEDKHFKTPIFGYEIRTFEFNLYTDGTLILFGNIYHWNGPNNIPKTSPFMQASAAHDAFFTLFQKGLLPMSEFDAVAAYFKQVIIEDRKAILPEGVEYRDNPFDRIAWYAVTTDIARGLADPDNHEDPKVMTAPDPDWLEEDDAI